VDAGGPRRDKQFGGYLAVAPADGDEPQHFQLERREPERRRGLRGVFTAAGAGSWTRGRRASWPICSSSSFASSRAAASSRRPATATAAPALASAYASRLGWSAASHAFRLVPGAQVLFPVGASRFGRDHCGVGLLGRVLQAEEVRAGAQRLA
jgi:hypothetical protein